MNSRFFCCCGCSNYDIVSETHSHTSGCIFPASDLLENIQKSYETYSVLLQVCMVAIVVNVMSKCCGPYLITGVNSNFLIWMFSFLKVLGVTFRRKTLLLLLAQEEKSIFWMVILGKIVSKIELFHCTDEQHFMSSRELHWCCLSNFGKCIVLGKLYQSCHLTNKYR
jgi:hypothetical protein